MGPVLDHVLEDDPIPKLIEQLEKEELDSIPVFDKKGKFIGDVHERDLLKLIILPEDIPMEELTGVFGSGTDLQYFATKAKDLVNRHELTISPDETVSKAAVIMIHHNLNSLPVLDKKGKLIGILTELHIMQEVFNHNKAAKKPSKQSRRGGKK